MKQIYCKNEFEYMAVDNQIIILSISIHSPKIIFPNLLSYKEKSLPVTAISSYCLYPLRRKKKLASIIELNLPDSLEYIRDYAFADAFPNSTEIRISFTNSIKKIGASAFLNCPISGTIVLNNAEVDSTSFLGTNISTIMIPQCNENRIFYKSLGKNKEQIKLCSY